MQRQRYRGVESNLFHQFLPPSDFLYYYVDAKIIQTCELSSNFFFRPLTSLVSLLKRSMKSLFMSRNGHDKNMTKMYRNGLMF